MDAQPKTTQRLKLNKIPAVTYRLIPARGSDVPAWPNDVKEIEVDELIYEVHDFYKLNRNEEIYPEGLVIQAFGKVISQAKLWQMYPREDNIFLFIAKVKI